RAQIYQLGLTKNRLGHNLFAGFLCFVAFTPLVYGVNFAAESFVSKVSKEKPTVHPLNEVAKAAQSKGELALVAFAVIVVAPLYEELFFRRILQGWLSKISWGGIAGFILAVVLSILLRWSHLRSAWTANDWHDLGLQIQPLAFVLL